MALENFGFIKDLVDTNPAGSDPKSQGDDHLRGVKETLKNQFSGLTEGIAVTATETDLNNTPAIANMSGKNFIINGDFSVWQRGDTGSGNGYFSCDRMRSSSTVITYTRITNTDPTKNYSNSLMVSRSNLGNLSLSQPIELSTVGGCDAFVQGSSVTFSGIINPTNATQGTCSLFWSDDGVGTNQVTIGAVSFDTLTPNTDNYVTATIEITEAPVSTSTCLRVSLTTTAVIDGETADFSNIKLELGSVATPFIPDDPATNLAKCMRYYQALGDYYFTATNDKSNQYFSDMLTSPMRTAPLYTKTGITDTDITGVTDITVNGTTAVGFSRFVLTPAGGFTGGERYIILGLALDAEL